MMEEQQEEGTDLKATAAASEGAIPRADGLAAEAAILTTPEAENQETNLVASLDVGGSSTSVAAEQKVSDGYSCNIGHVTVWADSQDRQN